MEDKNTIEVSSWDEVEKNATPVTSFEETETVKKKEPTTPASATPVSQVSEPLSESGVKVSEPIDLPKSYQDDRTNYKDLVGGGRYNLIRGGKPVTGTWDEATQTFIKDPLLNATPQRKKEVGFLQAVEAGVNLEAPVETQEEMFGRLGVEVDDLKNEAKQKLSNIDYITNYPSVQRLGELEKLKNSTEDLKVKSDIEKQISELRSKKMSDKEFEGIRFDNAEGEVYQNFLPAKQVEEFKGEVKKLPKTDLTVGEAYDEAKDDSDYVQQVQGEIKGYGDMVNQYMISKLPEETKAKLEALKGTPEYDTELEKELVQSKEVENIIPALAYGLDKKLDALMEVGSNIGLDDDRLAQKKLGDIREKQMFGKNMASTRAEVASSIGGMLPDIAAGSAFSPLMLASMISTMPNDFLEQCIAEQQANGEPIDVNKCKQYALASTAAQTAMLVGAGKVGAHGLNLVGKTGLKRAGELIYEMAKRGTKDAIVFGVFGTVMQNKINKAYDLAENDEYLKQGLHMGIIGGAFALKEGIGKVKGVSKKTQNEVDYLASYLPEEYTRKQVEQLTQLGKITPADGEETLEKLNTIRAIRNQIPAELSIEQMDKIYPMWIERREIQAMLNGASSEFKSVLSGQVEDIDRKILIKAAIPLTSTEKLEMNILQTGEAENKTIDKARLRYLEERNKAAKEVKQERKELEQKEKVAEEGKEVEYKRLVEPTKPISEMNSKELYNLAIENKKALKEQDKEFASKTEKEKEDGGYYSAIDDVSDLRDASEKISWVESSKDADEVAKNIRSTVAKMDKNNISEYDLAIINAATLKAEEFGVSKNDFIDKVVKAEFERHENIEDAEFMAKSLREKIVIVKEEPAFDHSKKTDTDVENRMTEISSKNPKFDSPEQAEFNSLEKEMEKRERNSVFGVPLEKASEAVDTLMKKEKDMPNGWGAFIEKRDARESKEVIEKYRNPREVTDAELKKDFKEAMFGNPDTWYADGLKLRESLNEASRRGIDTKQLVAEIEKEFVADGYNKENAHDLVARKLRSIYEGVAEPALPAKELTPQQEAVKFLDDHAVQDKIDTYGIRPDFRMSSEELEIAMRHIRAGKLDGVSAKNMLSKIAEWKAQGFVDLIHLKGGTTVRLSAPFDIAEALAKLPKEDADVAVELNEKLDAPDLDKIVADNYTDADGNLNREKLAQDLADLKNNAYFGDLLLLDQTDLENLKTYLTDEKSGTTTEIPDTKSENKIAYRKKSAEEPTNDTKPTKERAEVKGKDKIARGLDKLTDALGTKSKFTDEERPKVIEALRDIAEGLIEEGSATVGNVIEKLKEYLKGKISDEDFDSVKDDIISSIKEKPDGKKKTLVTERAYEGEVREGVKKELEKIGLTRDIDKLDVAEAKAKEFVAKVGEENALDAIRNGDVDGATAAFVFKELAESLNRKAATETDATEVARLEKLQADLLNEWGNRQWKSGAFNSAMQKILVDSELNFNSAEKAAKWEKELGEKPSDELMAKWKAQDAEIKELNKRLAEAELKAKEAEGKQAIQDIKESIEREKKSKRYTVKAKEVADGIRKLKNKPIELRDENGNIIDLTTLGVSWNDIVESVAKTIEAGGKIADAIDSALKGVSWYDKLTDKGKEAVKSQIEDSIRKQSASAEMGKLNVPHSLIRELVESGIDNIGDLVKAVQNKYPKLSEREIRDAITGYGKISNPNKEEIEVKIRKIKRIGKAFSALEDIANKKRPLRSGQQRDKLDAEERALNKELREAMKELPIEEADLEAQLKTQLDATKQRVTNQIEDLQREIAKGELTPKSARSVKEDAELKALKEKRDKLKEEHEKIFKDEEYKTAKRLELSKKAAIRSIEDLQRRLSEGDFSKKKTTPVIADSELIKIRAEKMRIKEEYDKEFYKAQLKNRTTAEKWKDSAWEAWNIPRVLMATGEMSFVGVQGLKQSVAHPLTAVKAFKNALNFMGSEKNADDWLRSIKSQEWYPTLKNSKLALTEPHAELTAREELFYSGWSNLVWDGLGRVITSPARLKSADAYAVAQEGWSKLNPLKALERAAVGYLDTIRVERFLSGMEMLQIEGKNFESNPQDYKDVADAINTMTGRASLGKYGNQAAPLLSKIFFSPRNWASGIKTATPYALIHFGKMTPTARKMAIGDFSKFVGLTTGMVVMAAARLNNDDDPNTAVEFDPRSTDFMKVKLGNIRVDPWGGMQQQVVFSSRIIADALFRALPQTGIEGGYKKNENVMPLGMERKSPTARKLIEQQALNKLNPTADLLYNYLNTTVKKDGRRVDDFSNEYTVKNELQDKFHPIFWSTAQELLKDDPNALDGLLTFYAFFGGGVNIYDTKPKK